MTVPEAALARSCPFISGLTLKPTTIALEAAASMTSDSVIPPTPL